MLADDVHNQNDKVVIVEHETDERRNLETTSYFKQLHVICTEKFPITLSKRIEIIFKQEKELIEIDLMAITNFRQTSLYFYLFGKFQRSLSYF